MSSSVDTSANSSFSLAVPGLQLAIDSTSLGEFKLCPRKYYYTIVLGYQPKSESVHLTFGLLLHEARERYEHGKTVDRLSHDEALTRAVKWGLEVTWNKALGRPWASQDSNKNRLTFLRTLIWYLDEFGANDPMQTVVLASGKPAIELSFSFDSGLRAPTGERVLLCGHLDRIATLNEVPYIVDLKTTKHTLDAGFFSKFNPDNQFSMYTLAGQVAFGVPVQALVVDAAQVAVTFSRFHRALVPRDKAQMSEWVDDTRGWIADMHNCAVTGHWRQNDKSCQMYGGCDFREVCSKPPGAREAWLAAGFRKRAWDPLKRRGDI